MITESQYAKSAALLGVEPAVIKAVAEVESRGDGLLPDGKPKILFEPHIFWKELIKRSIRPESHVSGNEDILYAKWQPGKYGPVSKQLERLNRAIKINRPAALSSASWGKFQIMGFNCDKCDCSSVEDFVSRMSLNEDEHLSTFICYLKSTSLDAKLRAHDWKGFARAYNGKSFLENKYDTKLAAAYLKFNQLP